MLGMLLAPSLATRTSASSVTNASLVARENLGEGWGPGSGHTRGPPPDPRDVGTSGVPPCSGTGFPQGHRGHGTGDPGEPWGQSQGLRSMRQLPGEGGTFILGTPPPTSSSLKKKVCALVASCPDGAAWAPGDTRSRWHQISDPSQADGWREEGGTRLSQDGDQS